MFSSQADAVGSGMNEADAAPTSVPTAKQVSRFSCQDVSHEGRQLICMSETDAAPTVASTSSKATGQPV